MIAALAAAGCGTPGTGARPRGRGGPVPLVPTPTPGPTSAVVVDVFGTPGLQFNGSFGELGDTKTIHGAVPTRLTLKAGSDGFRVALQKRGPDGELGITVTIDGRTVSRSSTKREFGVVTYTYRPASK